MASITIRKLDDGVKERLRVRAAKAGRSMEEEAREILTSAVQERRMTGPELLKLAKELFGPEHGIDLPPIPRGPDRSPPDFSE
jgi:plasmid stability protein